jgi:hypothetical protein
MWLQGGQFMLCVILLCFLYVGYFLVPVLKNCVITLTHYVTMAYLDVWYRNIDHPWFGKIFDPVLGWSKGDRFERSDLYFVPKPLNRNQHYRPTFIVKIYIPSVVSHLIPIKRTWHALTIPVGCSQASLIHTLITNRKDSIFIVHWAVTVYETYCCIITFLCSYLFLSAWYLLLQRSPMEFCCMRWISAFTLEQLRAVSTKRTTLHVIMGEIGPKKCTAMPYVISAT